MYVCAHRKASQVQWALPGQVHLWGGSVQGRPERQLIMGHRAKHRRENWIPERLARAAERAKLEAKRQVDAAKEREGAKHG